MIKQQINIIYSDDCFVLEVSHSIKIFGIFELNFQKIVKTALKNNWHRGGQTYVDRLFKTYKDAERFRNKMIHRGLSMNRSGVIIINDAKCDPDIV